MDTSKKPNFPQGLLLFALVVLFTARIIHLYEPFTFLNFDPGWQFMVVRSLAEDGDFDLRNQLQNDPTQASDQIALGANGEWYNVHEGLLPVLTVPFYLLFGLHGTLVFNALLLLGTMMAVYHLGLAASSARCCAIAVFIVAITLADWSYSYSVDVFGALLVVMTLFASIRELYAVAGFLLALSIVGRVSNVAAIPAFLYLMLSGKDPVRSGVKLAAGALPVFVLFLVSNWRMFGGPFELSYFHQAYLAGDALEVHSQQRLFSVNPLSGIKAILFDPQHGLIPSYPVATLSFVFGFRALKSAHPRLLTACTIIGLGFLSFYSTYAGAVELGGGTRHFLPLIVLSAIPLSCALEKLGAAPNG